MNRVRWGVLGTAAIATRHVIPAMLCGHRTHIVAVASRDRARADGVARQFGIPSAHGSYDELLDASDVDAVYIPLPNHLHVPWSLEALNAGKHVLCEKPIGLAAAEAQQLLERAARSPTLRVGEAFMYRCHPQWLRTRALVQDGAIGALRAIQTWFSYCNTDPANIRNIEAAGGGALMDIGCYGISLARFLFAREPRRVSAAAEIDPAFGTDRLTSATLDFGDAMATFVVATQLARRQSVVAIGSDGWIEIEQPFNPPIDRPTAIRLQRGDRVERMTFEPCNQFTIQGDAFSEAILSGADVPVGLADSVANMRAIDAVRASVVAGGWVDVPAC